MISRTDFEDLFPEIFPSRGLSADCVARWEDDGGRPAGRGLIPVWQQSGRRFTKRPPGCPEP